MCKKCWLLVLVLFAVIAAGAWKFIVQGSVEEGSDGRLSLQLEASERDLILTEMRAFLESVQNITSGLSSDRMELVVGSARSSGAAAQQAVPASLIGKLPLEFKKLGFDTHRKFDELALDAEQLGDKEHTLSQLSVLMQNCVACHAAYRVDSVRR